MQSLTINLNICFVSLRGVPAQGVPNILNDNDNANNTIINVSNNKQTTTISSNDDVSTTCCGAPLSYSGCL